MERVRTQSDTKPPRALTLKILGAFEQKLAEMASDEERKAYQEEQKCNSNLDKIIVQVKFCRFLYIRKLCFYTALLKIILDSTTK